MSKKPIYETWGRPDVPGARAGIQRTLVDESASDQAFLSEGICIVGDDGVERKMTTEEANRMGIRRIVAARDIRTGELRTSEDDFFVVKAGRR